MHRPASNSCLDDKELSYPLCNPEVYYRVHKNTLPLQSDQSSPHFNIIFLFVPRLSSWSLCCLGSPKMRQNPGPLVTIYKMFLFRWRFVSTPPTFHIWMITPLRLSAASNLTYSQWHHQYLKAISSVRNLRARHAVVKWDIHNLGRNWGLVYCKFVDK